MKMIVPLKILLRRYILAALWVAFFPSATLAVDSVSSYTNSLQTKQLEATNLTKYIENLDQSLALNQAQLEQSKISLTQFTADIENIRTQKQQIEYSIIGKKNNIRTLVNEIYTIDSQSDLEKILQYNTLSDFSSGLEYNNSLNGQLVNEVVELSDLKVDLHSQLQLLRQKKQDVQKEQQTIEAKQNELVAVKQYKESVLQQVQGDENRFQELLAQAKQEQQQLNISDTEAAHNSSYSVAPDDTGFDPAWSVYGPITAYFHDPDYPYRDTFEHPAIDIAVPQGTPIHAADSGVVAIAQFDDTSAYARMQINHGNLFSTVYGHVSAIYVYPGDIVTKGQVIALSGGTPGSVGSGLYTTGPHLHFGILLDGIPVNPLDYLPK